jgi:hypothetical protein
VHDQEVKKGCTFSEYELIISGFFFSFLQSLVHVSTAYCNCDRDDIKEIVYPPPHDPEQVIQAMTWMDDELVKEMTPK